MILGMLIKPISYILIYVLFSRLHFYLNVFYSRIFKVARLTSVNNKKKETFSEIRRVVQKENKDEVS